MIGPPNCFRQILLFNKPQKWGISGNLCFAKCKLIIFIFIFGNFGYVQRRRRWSDHWFFFNKFGCFLKPINGEFQEIWEEISIYSFFFLRSRFLPKRVVQAVCLVPSVIFNTRRNQFLSLWSREIASTIWWVNFGGEPFVHTQISKALPPCLLQTHIPFLSSQ